MRWIISTVLSLLALALLAFGLLAMVPSDRVAQLLSRQFETMTGRTLQFTGEIKPRLWPSLGITTGPVSIANAEWSASDAPLFHAENLAVDINLGALLGGDLRIERIEAIAPAFNLERAADGKQNWVFGADVTEGQVPTAATGFTLDQGTIRGGSLRFVDAVNDRTIAFDDVDLDLMVTDFTGPFTLTATALSEGQPVALDLKGETFSAFAAGRVVQLSLNLQAGGSKLDFTGRGGTAPLAAEGRLVADLSDLPTLGRLWGANLSRPEQGFGQTLLTLAADITVDGKGGTFLRNANIVADRNELTGDLDLVPGADRPKLSAQLVAGPLTFDKGGDTATPTPSAATEGWSDAEIDVSGLATLDAEIGLTTPSVKLGHLTFTDVATLITLDRARAVIDIRNARAYEGNVTGDFVINGRGGLSVGGRLNLTDLATQPLFTDVLGWNRLISTGDVQVEFLGVGNSIAAIMSTLEGQGTLGLGPGEIRGLDVGAMLRTLEPTHVGEGERTAFDALAGTFVMQNGILSNSDLKMVSPYFTASGAGDINIGARTLDYRLRPTALAAEDGSGGVMVPLLISGPWSDPSFQLDLESIARERMEEEARQLEERARAALEQQVEDALGVEVPPDQDLGDAAIEGVQDAIEDEARDLLEDLLR